MSDNIDVRVTPALRPEALQVVDGYSQETAPYLAPVATALSEAYEGISKVHTARDKARSNPTWNEASQIIQTQQMADKVFANIAKRFDRVKADLDGNIRSLEADLSTPLASKASLPLASEIRAHAKALTTGDRAAFVAAAIQRGDEQTVSSLLGSPSYLSGLTAEMQDAYTKMWHREANPGAANRLKAMQGARDMLMDRAGLVHIELEKAVGERRDKVNALRRAQSEAEQAFVLSSA